MALGHSPRIVTDGLVLAIARLIMVVPHGGLGLVGMDFISQMVVGMLTIPIGPVQGPNNINMGPST